MVHPFIFYYERTMAMTRQCFALAFCLSFKIYLFIPRLSAKSPMGSQGDGNN
jgi:hypothetical protein